MKPEYTNGQGCVQLKMSHKAVIVGGVLGIALGVFGLCYLLHVALPGSAVAHGPYATP